jgi:hypothetical protein
VVEVENAPLVAVQVYIDVWLHHGLFIKILILIIIKENNCVRARCT